MPLAVPSRSQIQAQLETVLRRSPEARCVAIRSPRQDAWPESIETGQRRFRLRWCDSPLAVRNCLVEIEDGDDDGVVLLTDQDETRLGADVLARLARARVFEVDSWGMVQELFAARAVDARLARHGWISNLLIENAPPQGYPPVPGGFLDLDTVWTAVLETCLGLPGPRPDVEALLEWASRADRVQRLAELPEAAREAAAQWLVESGGSVARLVMAAILAGHGLDALPAGLVCGVLFASAGAPAPDLVAAAVRMERFVGGERITTEHGQRWARAAAAVVRRTSENPDAMRPVLSRADELLHELHIVSHAGLSDLLPSGLDARLTAFASALQSHVAEPLPASLVAVEHAAAAVLRHEQALNVRARSERVRMALRLARWLTAPVAPSPGLAGLVAHYARQGAFVDWARMQLMGGDELAVLSGAYARLGEAARDRREEGNRRFARALADWNAQGGEVAGCVPVERVLDKVVAPIATKCPVLLLVVDGLSLPIFEELARDVAAHGWEELVPAGSDRSAVGLAAFPTVTEVSRASLLAGMLTTGASNKEKAAFAAHPALLAASRPGTKPVVFHKGELGDVSGLAQEIRDAVANRDRTVVGVVFNGVDDNLSGSNQLHPRWTLDDLRLLKPLLHEARLAGRALVITADHGHVLDERTVQRKGTEGDRWRLHDQPVSAHEVVLTGGRVRTAVGADQIVCAWSEQVRFSFKKNGYHGGVSPQEVIVPLAVFVPLRTAIPGWDLAPPRGPEWWEASPAASDAAAAPPQTPVSRPSAPARQKKLASDRQPELFGEAPQQPQLFGEAPQPSATDWIAAVLAAPVYLQQRQLAARVAPSDEDMRALLAALDTRGGKLGKTALAQRLRMPLMRVSGFVNAARRVLNVDQAAVLELDESAGEVRLNRQLLEQQFQVRTR